MSAGRHAIGHGQSQRAQHGLDDLLRAVGACRDRSRRQRIDDGAGRRQDLDRPVAARIGRHMRIDHRDHHVVGGGVGVGDGRVGVAFGLAVGAGQIDDGAAVVDGELDRDADRAIVDAVVVDEILAVVDAGGNARAGPGACAARNSRAGRRRRARTTSLPYLRNRRSSALDADHQRRHLGANVAQRLVGHADLIGDDADDLLVLDAALEQLHHRQPQTLEVDFADAAGDAARRDAAEVGVVRDVADEADRARRRGTPARWRRGP